MLILNGNIQVSDTGIYFKTSLKASSKFYKDDNSRKHPSLSTLDYPPFAIHWIKLPSFINSDLKTLSLSNFRSYNKILRFQSFIVDCLLFLIISILTIKQRMNAKSASIRFFVYIISGHFLFHLMYDRLDLVLSLFLFLGCVFQIIKRPFLSGIAFIIGILFKFMPIFLIPAWMIGFIPSKVLKNTDGFFCLSTWEITLKRLILLLGVLFIVVFIYLQTLGVKSFSFISWQVNRGLHLESVYSNILLLFSKLGLPVKFNTSYGSFNISAPLSDVLTSISLLVIIITIIVIIVSWLRNHLSNYSVKLNSTDIATYNPDSLIFLYLVCIVGLLITSKVLSPQYFIWLIPFISILSHKIKLIDIFLWFTILGLTTAIFPYSFWDNIIRLIPQQNGHMILGPDTKGIVLLTVRNGLLITLFFRLLRYKKIFNQ